jgi:hypothetical protein
MLQLSSKLFLLQIELEALWTGSTLAIELEALFSRVIVM